MLFKSGIFQNVLNNSQDTRVFNSRAFSCSTWQGSQVASRRNSGGSGGRRGASRREPAGWAGDTSDNILHASSARNFYVTKFWFSKSLWLSTARSKKHYWMCCQTKATTWLLRKNSDRREEKLRRRTTAGKTIAIPDLQLRNGEEMEMPTFSAPSLSRIRITPRSVQWEDVNLQLQRKGRPVVHHCWQEHFFSFFLEIDFIRIISRCLPTLNRDLRFRSGLDNT